MKNFLRSILWFFLLSAAGAPFAQAGSCGQENVRVEGATALEEAAVCRSLESIRGFFTRLGLSVAPTVTVFFSDQVLHPQTGVPLFGYYDSDTQEIHQLHFRAPPQATRRAWGLAWNDELAESFLLHELTHSVVLALFGGDAKKIPSLWHEAIAYHVQLELMPPALQAAVREYSPDATPFADTSFVSQIFYKADPHLFALCIHLSIRQWGGGEFLKKLLKGEVGSTGSAFNLP